MRGALRNKTILLVTHQVDFLHNVDLILVSVNFYLIYPFYCPVKNDIINTFRNLNLLLKTR